MGVVVYISKYNGRSRESIFTCVDEQEIVEAYMTTIELITLYTSY